MQILTSELQSIIFQKFDKFETNISPIFMTGIVR